MTTFHPGDRVRVESLGEDGLPVVRYGFVGAGDDDADQVTVLLDDELTGSAIVDRRSVLPIGVTTLALNLHGADLLSVPELRRGLVRLWAAEAEAAGLEISALHHTGDGLRDSSEGYVIAELVAGGEHFVLRATRSAGTADTVLVRADRPNRWDV